MPLAGALYAALAYGMWGVLLVYWKMLAGVPLLEVLAHRVIGTVLFTALLLAALRQMPELGLALRSRRERLSLLASGILIALNWGVFIWAVGAGRIVETSLGYYLNPIVNVLLGTLFLGERLRRGQWIAVALAALGVLVMLVSGVLIAINWSVFIWAVGAGRIVETSLGYYLNPIVNVLLGTLFLRERLSRALNSNFWEFDRECTPKSAGVRVTVISTQEWS